MTFLMSAASLAIGGAGSATSALAEKKAGYASEVSAEGEATQLEDNAAKTVADASFTTNRIQQKVKQILGTQRTLAAAGGGDTLDQSTREIADDTVRQSSIDEIVNNANAEDEAAKMRYQAKIDRISGQASNTLAQSRATATTISGVGTLLGQAANWATLYGGAKKPATQATSYT